MLVIKNTFACVCPASVCVCVCVFVDWGNFVVIILGYTANAGARRVPTVCHCIDTEGDGRGVGCEGKRGMVTGLFFWQPLHGIGFGFYSNRITDKQCQQQF